MSRYGRCNGCGRNASCDFLARAKVVLSGHGGLIVSVKVNCRRAYEADFQPGDRVRVKGDSDFPDEMFRAYGKISAKARQWLSGESGTVLSWSKTGKVNVLLDHHGEDEGEYLYVDMGEHEAVPWCRLQSLQHRDIAKIDEPRRVFCEPCSVPMDAAGQPETWAGRNDAKCGGCAWGFDGTCPHKSRETVPESELSCDQEERPF